MPTNEAGVRKDESPRFNPQKSGAVNTGTDTITLPYSHGLTDDDAVVYSAGGGTPIGGLVDGQKYYAKVISPTQLQLLDKKASDGGGSSDLTSTGAGKSHSLVPDGNTPSGDASAYGPRTIKNGTVAGFRGVAVTATNSDDIAAVGISAGIAGTAAVNLAGSINVVNVYTKAYIGASAKVNCGATCDDNVTGANAGQSVQVAAANQFYELGIAASLAIGGTVGVAVPVGVRVVNLTTEARIDGNAQVNARNNIVVTADAKDAIVSVAAGAGGGTVGVAGSSASPS